MSSKGLSSKKGGLIKVSGSQAWVLVRIKGHITETHSSTPPHTCCIENCLGHRMVPENLNFKHKCNTENRSIQLLHSLLCGKHCPKCSYSLTLLISTAILHIRYIILIPSSR